MKVSDPTQYQIWKELKYNPYTGIFLRRATGERACRSDKTKGYLRVFVLGNYYKAHRLAWFYKYAQWPSKQIDHINGVKTDNRLENLRDVSQTVNMYNKTQAYKNNGTGVLGVTKSGDKFVSRVRHAGRLIHVGTFDTAEEAHNHYITKRQEIIKSLVPC